MRNVVVTETLPAGIEFLSASDRGTYRPETRTINWVVDGIEPGQTRLLVAKVQAKIPGQREVQAVARAQGGDAVQNAVAVTISGMPALGLKITERDDPVEFGKETVYEICIVNQGTALDSGLHLQTTLPDGMTLKNVRGPTSYRAEGQNLVFAPLARLDPGREAVYQVSTLAQRPGTYRLRAQVTSTLNRTPISREERTLVYQD